MLYFFNKCNDRQGWALFIVRIVLGSIFFAHGAQKVFGIFGGQGLDGFVQWGTTLGIPVALSYLGAFAEFIGGCLLLLGVATEVGALLTIGVMIGAIVYVHWGHGYFLQNNGFEYPLNLIFLALAVIIGGPGNYALWDPCSICCKNKNK